MAWVDDQFAPGGEFFVERIEANYVKFRSMFEDWGVQVARATNGEFVIGDDPVQTADSETGRVGVLAGVTVEAADTLLMPCGPRHAIAVAKNNSWLDVNATQVDVVNRVQVISAQQKVYFRPGAALEALIDSHWESRLVPGGGG